MSVIAGLLFGSVVAAAEGPNPPTAVEEACPPGPLRVAANPRYFADGCGRPVYLTGSHTHLSFKDGGERPLNISPFDYEKYLDLMQTNNHNFMRMWSGWELPRFAPLPWRRTGPGTARDGELKFDLMQFDETYFERLRDRVLAARERNIYVSVMLFEGWLLRFTAGSAAQHPFSPANNINGIKADADSDGKIIEAHSLNDPTVTAIQEAYVRKVIDTLNDLDNVLYEIANESDFPESVKWQYHMIEFIKKYQESKPKQHPVGITSAGFSSPYDDLADLQNSPADWISPGRPASLAHDYLENPPAADGVKVIISDSDHLATELKGPSWIWKSATRGLNPIFMDAFPPLDILGTADVTMIRKNLGYARVYADKMDLLSTTPRPELASTRYALANPGVEYLVYQPASGRFTVNLPRGAYRYEWFNPATGSVAGKGSLTASDGTNTFSPPFSGIAVLYLKAETTATGS
ncbi:MAG TPA: DUF6298 domain-containing protein [Candidatus Binatia bacterium]|nr:DUF6298 domain-containing protein [Candidatus Binatia bacterium]